MLITTRRIGVGALSAIVVLAIVGCKKPVSCVDAPECKAMGKCSVGPKRVCVISSDRDCRQSDSVPSRRALHVQGQRVYCGHGRGLQDFGALPEVRLCEARNGTCVNLAREFHPACAEPCKAEGLCAQKGGKCVALSDYHCRRSSERSLIRTAPAHRRGVQGAERPLRGDIRRGLRQVRRLQEGRSVRAAGWEVRGDGRNVQSQRSVLEAGAVRGQGRAVRAAFVG